MNLEIKFGEDGNSEAFIGSGWSHSEPLARWAIGTHSYVAVPFMNYDGDMLLTVVLLPHLNPFRVAQRVIFYLNDVYIEKIILKDSGFSSIDLRIPNGLISDSDNILRIYHPDSSIPADYEGGDVRDIAIYVKSITFQPWPQQHNKSASSGQELSIDFSEGGNCTSFLGSGWSHQEPLARWAIGSESFLKLPSVGGDQALQMKIQFMPHLNPYRVTQRATYFVNGIEVGKTAVSEGGFSEFSIAIPAALMSEKENDFRIYHPDASVPAEFEGGDIRNIAMYVRYIEFKAIQNLSGASRSLDLSNGDLLNRFESLGDNCEFGMVQRKWGTEPIGLLRFAAISFEGLLRGLKDGFDRVGQDVEVRVEEANEFMIFENTYNFRFHTFIYEGDKEQIASGMAKRIKFLKRKISEDFKGNNKIFVYRQTDGLMPEQIEQLSRALNALGQNILMVTSLPPPGKASGTIDVISDTLIRAYISHFQPLHDGYVIMYDEWLEVCRQAYGIAKRRGYFNL